jgi:flagellin-specific chaperone FliS
VSYGPQGDAYRIYREQQVANLSTGRLVLLALETALRACRKGQRGLLIRVLEELMAGLDLDQGEVAIGLLRLYEYSLRMVREGQLGQAESILQELRHTWEAAVKAEEKKAANLRGVSREAVAAPGA